MPCICKNLDPEDINHKNLMKKSKRCDSDEMKFQPSESVQIGPPTGFKTAEHEICLANMNTWQWCLAFRSGP